jgi:large subunit ribosomal protein L25
MAQNLLQAEPREARGKGVARKLRQAGRIPAVLYGRGKPAMSLVLDPRALEQLLQRSDAGINTLIDLKVAGAGAGEERVVLVKELQRDPVVGSPLHVDLYQVDLSATVEVEVPIQLVGKAVGVELHDGVLDHSLRALEIECLPRAIPESIQVDVSGLDVGDSLHVRDLALPGGVTLRSDPDLGVASVVAAKVAEEEVAAEAAPVEGEEPVAAPAEGAPEAAAETEKGSS